MLNKRIGDIIFVFLAVYSSIALISIGVVFGDINTWGEGYKADPGATIPNISVGNVDGSAPSGLCKQVVNSSGNAYFVPTRTTAEWTAFEANAPAGTTILDCGPSGPAQTKVTPPALDGDDYFGTDVGLDYTGTRAVVGAPSEDGTAANGGAAYVYFYDGSNWGQQQRLVPGTLTAGNNFGKSVGMTPAGDRLVVGANNVNISSFTMAGAAYVFIRSGATWTEHPVRIVPSVSEVNQWFGWSVSILGTQVVVGAPYEDAGMANSGKVYLFADSTTYWWERAQYQPSDRAAGDLFGYSVDYKSFIIIGAPGKDSAAGAVYVYNNQTPPAFFQKLTASDREAGDYFGWNVAFSTDSYTAAVGAPGEDSQGAEAGAVYIFKRAYSGLYSQAYIIKATDGVAGNRFGERVALNETGWLLAVSAPNEDAGGADTGAVYLFERNNGNATVWTQKAKLQASDRQPGDYFGTGLALSGNRLWLAVGASNEDAEGAEAGAAYFFDIGADICGWERHFDDTEWGCSANCSWNTTYSRWQQDGSGMTIVIRGGSGWYYNYRPTKMRVQMGGPSGTISLGSAAGGQGCGGDSAVSGQEIPISCSVDFQRMNLYVDGYPNDYVSDIEFYCCPGDCTGMECNESCGVSCGSCGPRAVCNQGTCACDTSIYGNIADCSATGRGNDADGCECNLDCDQCLSGSCVNQTGTWQLQSCGSNYTCTGCTYNECPVAGSPCSDKCALFTRYPCRYMVSANTARACYYICQ